MLGLGDVLLEKGEFERKCPNSLQRFFLLHIPSHSGGGLNLKARKGRVGAIN